MPLPEGGEGNPGDVVEINGDMFVTAVGRLRRQEEAMESIRDRIGWWLDQGGDEWVNAVHFPFLSHPCLVL